MTNSTIQFISNIPARSQATRGRLTVFLGAAPCVGKTYKMLETARQRLADGADVAIGWLETRGDAMLEQAAADLPRIAQKRLSAGSFEAAAMDIDAILSRRPELVLVDELAHRNPPGSRHVRRYQDIFELLRSGIHVYTTVNIHHIESLNDIVAKITGMTVTETIPDSVLEQADSIQLIDVPPDELITRMQERKDLLSPEEQQRQSKFFRSGNITALRELALRFTASSVDEDLVHYMRQHQISGPWPTAGRIMVCVSASPFSTQLIRAARRLAGGAHAELLAVHVETAGCQTTDAAERQRIARNLRLAEELGGTTLTVVGDDLPRELLEVARTHNVTAIVVGKPRHGRLREFLRGSLVDKLILHSGDINVYVIQASTEQQKPAQVMAEPAGAEWQPWWHYAGGPVMTAVVSAVSWLFATELQPVNIALLYLLPAILAAVWWGHWPSYITAFCSVLLYDYLFVPPLFAFTVEDIPYAWSFLIFIVISFLVGGRTERLRLQARSAYQRERITRALYEFSREIASVSDLTVIAGSLAANAGEITGRQTVVSLPDQTGKLSIYGAFDPRRATDNDQKLQLPESEAAIAQWAYEQGQAAGCSTETLAAAHYIHAPLLARDSVMGVMSLQVVDKHITPEEQRGIDAWASLAAISIERVKLAEAATEAAMLVESDKLRTALFNSISHELRTPLASIVGSVSTLLEAGGMYSDKERTELLETVQEGAARMERIVTNLLDSARLESGMLTLKTDWCDVEDLIGTAIRRSNKRNDDYRFEVNVEPSLPLIQADFVLLEQVLLNLLDNAKKYSPGGSPIRITANQTEEGILLSVLDRGLGISQDDVVRIFDKFYRVHHAMKIPGTGLGLSICKGIVEAHGGRIWAEPRPDSGTAVHVLLPLNSAVPAVREGDENG